MVSSESDETTTVTEDVGPLGLPPCLTLSTWSNRPRHCKAATWRRLVPRSQLALESSLVIQPTHELMVRCEAPFG